MQEQYYITYYQAIINENLEEVANFYLFNEDERSRYKTNYSTKTYSKYFEDEDPEDVIQDLLDKNEEFYTLLKLKIGIIAGNYYVASYQATIEQNAKKANQLDKFVSQEKIQYSNEYPDLNYVDIFADNDPDEVLNIFLGNDEYKEFYSQFLDAENDLATEENITLREANYLELMKHPLTNYCSSPTNGLAIIDNLASISYSKVINKSDFVYKLVVATNQSPLVAEILSTTAISANIQYDKQISIVLIGENIQEYDPTMAESDAGGFHPLHNKIIITNENQKLNLPTLVHEVAHHSMHLLFNNMGTPYYKDSAELKTQYHQAIKSTLLNIKQFMHHNFNANVSHIKNTDTTWEIGSKLGIILDSICNHIFENQDFTSIKPVEALARLLILYVGNYNQNSEDNEFIVRLPEIIAAKLYEDEVIEIFSPIAQYWKEIVSEATIEYQYLNSYSNVCLPLIGNNEFTMQFIE